MLVVAAEVVVGARDPKGHALLHRGLGLLEALEASSLVGEEELALGEEEPLLGVGYVCCGQGVSVREKGWVPGCSAVKCCAVTW